MSALSFLTAPPDQVRGKLCDVRLYASFAAHRTPPHQVWGRLDLHNSAACTACSFQQAARHRASFMRVEQRRHRSGDRISFFDLFDPTSCTSTRHPHLLKSRSEERRVGKESN